MNLPAPPNYAWMYWEDVPGRRRAAYLDLCLETVQRQAAGLDLIVTGRDSIFDHLPDLDRQVWDLLPGPNFRSDYARTRLLHRYGGLWLDFDLIAVRSLQELLAPLRYEETLGWGKENRGRFYAGLCAARPGARFVAEWLHRQDLAVEKLAGGSAFPWASLAQHITEHLASQIDYRAWPMVKIAPVMWWEWRRFTSRLDSPRRVLSLAPYTVMLFHKVMGPWFGSCSADEMLRGRSLLSRLLRICLGISSVAAEEADIGALAPVARMRFSRLGQEVEKQYRWRLRRLPADEL